jgi:hypothetical protein
MYYLFLYNALPPAEDVKKVERRLKSEKEKMTNSETVVAMMGNFS